jgi:putative transcriptional regulator
MSTIKAIRERLGLTQAALAEGIGCTQGNVWHYEQNGQTVPPEAAKRLIAFARGHGLELTMDRIYGLEPLPASASPTTPAQA